MNAPENFSAVIVDDVTGTDCLPNGIALPFMEDWSNGNTAGFWTFEDNWVINGQFGNPEPSAEFKWDPILTNYSKSLISGYFNGVSFESKDDPYVDGDFILEFDLKLESVNHTGDEYLYVIIRVDGIADTVAIYNNSSGNIEWEHHEINISEEAFGKVFRVQFMASGTLSPDILSWFIDNIDVYHYCAPAEELSWERIQQDTILLYWTSPLLEVDKNEIETRAVVGYNIFWKIDNEPFSFLDFTNDTFYKYGLTLYGDYYFYVTALYESCESDISNWIFVPYPPIGIGENNLNSAIWLYPNPARDKVHIRSEYPLSAIRLTDHSGRQVDALDAGGAMEIDYDVSACRAGIYFIQAETETTSLVQKLIILD